MWSFAAALALSIGLLVGGPAVAPVEATIPQGAITWTVNDTNKTITISVKLQIYSACDECPGAVNQFLVDKMKAQIMGVWNQNYHFRCYKLIFEVDIKLTSDRFHIDGDRVGVRIDNSPVPVRSYVNDARFRTIFSPSTWNSDDPADKVVPTNDAVEPTTWRESANWDWTNTYAHEFGHIIGLDDAYEDATDANGNTVSIPIPGAPLDLMSTMAGNVSQTTIDRLIARSPVDRAKLKCGYTYKDITPLGEIKGTKCDGAGGEWTVQGDQHIAVVHYTTLWNVTIDANTLAGTYKYEDIQDTPGTVTVCPPTPTPHVLP